MHNTGKRFANSFKCRPHDLIMLEVDDILPSPLTPLVLIHPVLEAVCEMQTPAPFTMAQSPPQPHSMDTAIYARMNPLPSPATSAYSSSDLPLNIENDTKLPLAPAGPPSSSPELPLKETNWCHSHLRYTQQPLTQQYPYHNPPAYEYFLLC